MADYGETILSKHAVLRIGDGAVVETVAKICAVTNVTINMEKDLNSYDVLPCDATDPAIVVNEVKSKTWKASASGQMKEDHLETFKKAFNAAGSVAFELRLVGHGIGASTPDRLFSGRGIFTGSYDFPEKGAASFDFQIAADGDLADTNVAALP